MIKDTILLVDGSNLIFRAYFAFQRSGLTTTDGRPSGAVFGFLRLFIDAVKKEIPSEVFVAWDPKGGSFRDKEFEYYKANRPEEMPEDLFVQLGEVRRVLDYLGVKQAFIEGIEADDIIGTLATKAVSEGKGVKIFSGDRDLFQLVNSKVSVLYPSRKGGLDLYQEKEVETKMGVKPAQIIAFKGLSGDSSDNIKGVPGVGEKTAQKLLAKYKTFDSIFENIDSVTPVKLQQKLRDNEQIARDSYYLATVKTDCDIDLDWDKPTPFSIDSQKLGEFIEEYGLQSLKTTLPSVFAEYGQEIDVSKEDSAEKVFQYSEPIQFSGEIKELQEQLCNVARIGIFQGEDNYIGFERGQNFYYAVVDNWSDVLSDYSGDVIVFDAKSFFKQNKIDCNYVDILLGLYIWNSSHRKTLENLFEEISVSDFNSACNGLKMLWVYDYIVNQLSVKQVDLWLRLENPVALILACMELEGVYIDRQHLEKLNKTFEQKIEEYTASIYTKIGREDFNINSTQQLSAALVEAGYTLGRKNKNGGYSTRAGVLEKLLQKDETGLIQDILDYRTVSKLHSSFTDIFLEMLDENSRLHTEYVQNLVASGRLSSKNPNLQNIPIRHPEYGPLIRSCFAAPQRNKVISADYSQIELRILAHVSNDPVLIEAFIQDQDIHARTASEIFGISLSQVTSKERGLGKTLNFALVYQQGVWATAKQLGISVEEAKEFINRYFERFKHVRPLLDSTLDHARTNGYVETVFGRRIYLKNINSSAPMLKAAEERVAFNAVLQGTGTGDVTKFAMVRIARETKKQNLNLKMLMQVHDELVFEVAEDQVEKAQQLIVQEMELGQPFKVPLKVDIGVGDNWAESK